MSVVAMSRTGNRSSSRAICASSPAISGAILSATKTWAGRGPPELAVTPWSSPEPLSDAMRPRLTKSAAQRRRSTIKPRLGRCTIDPDQDRRCPIWSSGHKGSGRPNERGRSIQEASMPKSNSGGTALATRNDIKGVLGDIDPANMLAILSLRPTVADLEQASVRLEGDPDVFGAGKPV